MCLAGGWGERLSSMDDGGEVVLGIDYLCKRHRPLQVRLACGGRCGAFCDVLDHTYHGPSCSQNNLLRRNKIERLWGRIWVSVCSVCSWCDYGSHGQERKNGVSTLGIIMTFVGRRQPVDLLSILRQDLYTSNTSVPSLCSVSISDISGDSFSMGNVISTHVQISTQHKCIIICWSTSVSLHCIDIWSIKNLMLEAFSIMMEDHALNKYLSHFLISTEWNMNFRHASRIHMKIAIDVTCKTWWWTQSMMMIMSVTISDQTSFEYFWSTPADMIVYSLIWAPVLIWACVLITLLFSISILKQPFIEYPIQKTTKRYSLIGD